MFRCVLRKFYSIKFIIFLTFFFIMLLKIVLILPTLHKDRNKNRKLYLTNPLQALVIIVHKAFTFCW